MKLIDLNSIINKVMNSKLNDPYLQLIDIGMLAFHNNSKVHSFIKSIKLNKKTDGNEILNINKYLISSVKDDVLYINILDNSNKFGILEHMLNDINYFYNLKYQNTNKELLFDYLNIIECEEIINYITKTSSMIDDNKIMELYDELNIGTNYKNYSNQLQINIIRPLYEYLKNNKIKYKSIIDNANIQEINGILIDTVNLNDPYRLSENYRIIKNIIKKISSN